MRRLCPRARWFSPRAGWKAPNLTSRILHFGWWTASFSGIFFVSDFSQIFLWDLGFSPVSDVSLIFLHHLLSALEIVRSTQLPVALICRQWFFQTATKEGSFTSNSFSDYFQDFFGYVLRYVSANFGVFWQATVVLLMTGIDDRYYDFVFQSFFLMTDIFWSHYYFPT